MNPEFLFRFNYGSASVLELVWTLVSLVGFVLSAQVLQEAYLDRAALFNSPLFIPGGERHILANQAVRGTTCTLALFALFSAGGVDACLTPSPAGDHPTAFGVTLAAVFLLANAVCVYASYTNRRDRVAFLHRLRARRAESATALSVVPTADQEREEGT